MKKVFIPLVLIALLFTSCEKNVSTPIKDNSDQHLKNSDPVNVGTVKCENGILVFSDALTLATFEYNANRLDMADLAKWEKSKGFQSQKSIFENIALKEYNLQIKPYEGMTDDEMRNIAFPGHCPEYIEALNNKLIVEIDDAGKYIDYNLDDSRMAIYLNKDGLYMVGNVLYCVKAKVVKSIENATIADGQALVKSFSSNANPTNQNIIVKAVLAGIYDAYKASGWVYSGSKYRASLSARYKIQTFGATAGATYSKQMLGYPLTVKTNAQHKNFWGNWNQYWGSEYIGGNASLHMEWSQYWFGPYMATNGLFNDFSTNYYFPSASNATITWHPFTGALVPNYFNYSIVTAPYNGYYGWPDKPINFHITAGLPGGCCGINCVVNW